MEEIQSSASCIQKTSFLFKYRSWLTSLCIILFIGLVGFIVKVDYFTSQPNLKCNPFVNNPCSDAEIALQQFNNSLIVILGWSSSLMLIGIVFLYVFNIWKIIRIKSPILLNDSRQPKIILWTGRIFYLCIFHTLVMLLFSHLIWYIIPIDADMNMKRYIENLTPMTGGSFVFIGLRILFMFFYLESIYQMSRDFGFRSIHKKFLFLWLILFIFDVLFIISSIFLPLPSSKPITYPLPW